MYKSTEIPFVIQPFNSFAQPDPDSQGVTKATNCTVSVIAASINSMVLLAINPLRLGAKIYNDSSAILYLKIGDNAAIDNFTTKLFQDDYFELIPAESSLLVTGIWSSAVGNAYITELN